MPSGIALTLFFRSTFSACHVLSGKQGDPYRHISAGCLKVVDAFFNGTTGSQPAGAGAIYVSDTATSLMVRTTSFLSCSHTASVSYGGAIMVLCPATEIALCCANKCYAQNG
jgi:hypothetical protein